MALITQKLLSICLPDAIMYINCGKIKWLSRISNFQVSVNPVLILSGETSTESSKINYFAHYQKVYLPE